MDMEIDMKTPRCNMKRKLGVLLEGLATMGYNVSDVRDLILGWPSFCISFTCYTVSDKHLNTLISKDIFGLLTLEDRFKYEEFKKKTDTHFGTGLFHNFLF